jgi:hypothetical protein
VRRKNVSPRRTATHLGRRAIGLGARARASALCGAAGAAQKMVQARKKPLAIQVNADI